MRRWEGRTAPSRTKISSATLVINFVATNASLFALSHYHCPFLIQRTLISVWVDTALISSSHGQISVNAESHCRRGRRWSVLVGERGAARGLLDSALQQDRRRWGGEWSSGMSLSPTYSSALHVPLMAPAISARQPSSTHR